MRVVKIRVLMDFLAIILMAHLWGNINCQMFPGYEIKVNGTVHVQRGLCVRVPCTFSVPSDVRLTRYTSVSWSKFIQGSVQLVASRVNSKYSSNGRFYLIGDVTGGDCSFIIEGAMDTDAGLYSFRIEDKEIKLTYPDVLPNVRVTEFTEKPTISSARLVEGKEVTLTCTSPGRCQKVTPEISWSGKVSDRRLMNYNLTHEDGSRSFHSNITFTPGKSDNGSPLYCTVTLQTEESTTEKQTLNVEYSPSLAITIEDKETNETTVTVKNGDTITMRCYADSNPKASITWYKEDTVVTQDRSFQTISLTLTNVTPSDAGRFLCSAENEHGVARRTVHIIYHNPSDSIMDKSSTNIILLAALGPLCLLLLALLVYAYWRKRKKKLMNAETEDPYTSLRRSDITSVYDVLQPMTPTETNIIGSPEEASHDYENVQKQPK
ncbi:sialic acid-binding Ig-like lectin 14 [Engystomops pustulosus]|uniref:sialic acid-binding Ig-like lectin 14 n=1 Tax=Engystomops pustulosus TaxID=76066 RepID=UPI003AFB15FD